MRIICGHGGIGQVASHADLETYHRMLVEVLDQVKQGIAAGQSLEDVVAKGVPPRWTGWFESSRGDSVMRGGPDGWLENIYRGLSPE